MTIHGEVGSAWLSLRGQRLGVVVRIAHRVGHWSRRGARARQMSFDLHVDQALSIARQVPALRVVPAPDVRRAAPR